MPAARLVAPLAALIAAALPLAAACSGGGAVPAAATSVATATVETPPAPAAAATAADAADADAGEAPDGAARERDFPAGPAFAVRAGYEPPADRVPSTGAWLPANGRPTLVFVDAIW